jgi:hypothetical protein
MRSTIRFRKCLNLGADRKSSTYPQNDAPDPKHTRRCSLVRCPWVCRHKEQPCVPSDPRADLPEQPRSQSSRCRRSARRRRTPGRQLSDPGPRTGRFRRSTPGSQGRARPALHRALPPAPLGQGDAGAKRAGRADAPAERPRLAAARGIGLAESIYLGEEGRQRRTEQIVLVGQIPIEGAAVKWALTRMEG